MRSAVFQGVGHPLKIVDSERPRAQPGELVFKVKSCGICASDLHAAELGKILPGIVLGHEYAGEVIEVGRGVTEWQIGDRLTALPLKPCGHCASCMAGHLFECRSLIVQGFNLDLPGAYAEYARCLATLAMKLPAALTDQDAALVEPLAVGLGACKTAGFPPGASVLILGAGIIGLAVAKWARFFGAAVIGVSEIQSARIQRAGQIGVDVVINAGLCADPVAEFSKQTGQPPSVIFECVGRPIIHKIIDMAPARAHLVLVGAGMQPEQFTVFSAAKKRLRMSFVMAYEAADFPFVLEMLAAGRITTDQLVSQSVSLDELPAMFEVLQQPNEHCKVLITP